MEADGNFSKPSGPEYAYLVHTFSIPQVGTARPREKRIQTHKGSHRHNRVSPVLRSSILAKTVPVVENWRHRNVAA